MGKGQVTDVVLRAASVARGQEGCGEKFKMRPEEIKPQCVCFITL